MVFSWLSLGITNLITSRSSGKAAINFEARARDKAQLKQSEAASATFRCGFRRCRILSVTSLPSTWT